MTSEYAIALTTGTKLGPHEIAAWSAPSDSAFGLFGIG